MKKFLQLWFWAGLTMLVTVAALGPLFLSIDLSPRLSFPIAIGLSAMVAASAKSSHGLSGGVKKLILGGLLLAVVIDGRALHQEHLSRLKYTRGLLEEASRYVSHAEQTLAVLPESPEDAAISLTSVQSDLQSARWKLEYAQDYGYPIPDDQEYVSRRQELLGRVGEMEQKTQELRKRLTY